jgi:hypothetical protein
MVDLGCGIERVLTIQQWLSAITILLHRPFHFYWREYAWSPAQQISPDNMPVQICLAAAQELCAVLSAYVEDLSRLPCDVIFPIVLAAATLWQCRKEFDAGHDRAEVKAQIDLCVKCLAIVGKIWKNAGDCRRRLIKGECKLQRLQLRRQVLMCNM